MEKLLLQDAFPDMVSASGGSQILSAFFSMLHRICLPPASKVTALEAQERGWKQMSTGSWVPNYWEIICILLGKFA